MPTSYIPTPQISWDEKIKEGAIAEMRDHREMDRLRAGGWWDESEQKGCFYGCVIKEGNNAIERVMDKWGLPLWVGYLSEAIFEGLEDGSEEQLDFPVRFLESIPCGVDLQSVEHSIAVLRLTKCLSQDKDDAIQDVINCHKNWEMTTEEQWVRARCKANNITNNSVRESARSSAWESAWESAAWSATWSAWESAKWSANTWREEAENLITEMQKLTLNN